MVSVDFSTHNNFPALKPVILRVRLVLIQSVTLQIAVLQIAFPAFLLWRKQD